jgi:hypothetical protein
MTTPNTTPSAFVPVEPVEHKPRNLVLCFDDTADLCGAYSSNVFRMFQLLRNDDITSQVVYYEVCPSPSYCCQCSYVFVAGYRASYRTIYLVRHD